MLMWLTERWDIASILSPPPSPLWVASCSLLALACWEDGYWISCSDSLSTFEINHLTQSNYVYLLNAEYLSNIAKRFLRCHEVFFSDKLIISQQMQIYHKTFCTAILLKVGLYII